jgi:hypothetical protein
VLVVMHQPGLHRLRVRQGNDRNYLVLTMDQDRIIKMRLPGPGAGPRGGRPQRRLLEPVWNRVTRGAK